MRAVIQRVQRASVTVNEEIVAEIGEGLLIMLGMFVGIRLVKLFPDQVYRYFVMAMTLVAAVIMIFS